MDLPKFSLGIGDRFGRQGRTQLNALARAARQGVTVAPVWNKSHREHTIVGSTPADVRAEADAAVAAAGWDGPYFTDADHISLGNVDGFLESSDFFTLDVAESIGCEPDPTDLIHFVHQFSRYVGTLAVPGIDEAFDIIPAAIEDIGRRYVRAVKAAAAIYRHIEQAKGSGAFVTEVSFDEAAEPQTPLEMLFILGALAKEGVPAQTIAPKFSGRFNKGVDYVGDPSKFAVEFEQDLAVIAYAVQEFGLPPDLKLSVHSGSDKFSLYAPIHRALVKFDVGLHLKTAGTTWLEEMIGLAVAGAGGLELAKEIYAAALGRCEELMAPYAPVIDIALDKLPAATAVNGWDAEAFAAALRHDPACPQYNPHVRQLLHVAYKVAAEMGDRYLQALDDHEVAIAENVTSNLYDRHIVPVFIGR